MRLIKLFTFALAAVLATGCGAPAENRPANTNTTNTNSNAPNPTAAAPTLEQLVALDKQATEAWTKSDGNFFNGLLADKFFMVMDGKKMGKAEMIKMVNETKCEMKSSESTEHKMTRLDDDTYVLTSKGTFDGTCMGQKVPSPVRAASVFVRSADKWLALYHNETPIIEPKAGAANTAAKTDPKKADDKKAVGEKPASYSNTASNSAGKTGAEMAESVQAQSDAITNALTTVETWGWEAWRLKDAKKLDEITAKDAAFVNPMGGVAATRAEVMTMLTDAGCSVTSTRITDNAASLITEKLAVLTYKGTAVGTCGGQKLVPVWGTTFFVKDGDAWKGAFMFESPV